MRREAADEVAHEAAQEGAATQADLGHAGFEEVAGVQADQVGIGFVIHRHVGDDAHAQAEADIGLDDVGVRGGQHHVGLETLAGKGLVELGAAGEAEDVGHQRLFRQLLQGQVLHLGQGVALGHDDAAVPAIAGHHHQVVEAFQTLGGDGEVDGAVGGHLGDLGRRALVHVQGHVRILLDEFADHVRQRIARLGVGGGDGQGALALVGELLGDLLDAFALAQDLAGGLDDTFAGRGHPGQVLAAAGEDLDPQLVFEQADLLADAGLRGIETLGRGGYVQVVVGDFPDISQLLQLHAGSSLTPCASI